MNPSTFTPESVVMRVLTGVQQAFLALPIAWKTVAVLFVAFVLATRCPGCLRGSRIPRVNRRTGGRFEGCTRYGKGCSWTG
jgi:hypothetical protein